MCVLKLYQYRLSKGVTQPMKNISNGPPQKNAFKEV